MSNNTENVSDENELNALNAIATLLVNGENILLWAIQRRLFALFNRRELVVVTENRFLYIKRGLFGGFDVYDTRWQDLIDSTVKVGVFSSDLFITVSGSSNLVSQQQASGFVKITGLRTEQTAAVYRYSQSMEQVWRERRRVREMEEMRASSGGININTSPNIQSSQGQSSALERLTQAKDLLDKGLISDAQYEEIKAKITSTM
jgi:hypothetical protein